jgi:uncharacterized protein
MNNEAIILKVIVDGAFSSGKTSFIEGVSENEVFSVDIPHHFYDMSISWDFGLIESDKNVKILFLGTPSTHSIDVKQAIIKHAVIGTVVMVDSSTNPGLWREAEAIIHRRAIAMGKPFVVVANKQDRPNAFSPENLRIMLNIPPEIPVVPCVATDKESVKRVLVALLDEVLKALAGKAV